MPGKKRNGLTRRDFLKLAGATVAASALAGCAKKEEGADGTPVSAEPVELIYHYGARVALTDLELVQDAMNEILEPKINATLILSPIVGWGDLTQKMQLKNAAGEKYDMTFTSSWANPYYDNIKNGVLVELTDLLPQYAPKYWKQINPGAWDASRVKGALYAAINEQIWPSCYGPHGPKEFYDKYDFDIESVTVLEDLEPFWDKVLAGEPSDIKCIAATDGGRMNIWSIYHYSESPGYGFIKLKEKDPMVTHSWEDEGWVAGRKAAGKWNKAGYYGKEPWPEADFAAKQRGGKFATYCHTVKPGFEAEMKAMSGFEWVGKIILDTFFLTTGGIIATMTGVSKQTSSAEACVKYFEEINTNKVLYNTFCYGIEDKHWVWVDKGKEVIGMPEGVTAENSPYNPNSDWAFGNQFNAYYTDPTKVGAWEATKKINDEAKPSPIIGFVFDREPVKTELAQVSAVTAEYKLMGNGFIDYNEVESEYISRVTDAGGDTILEELNKQLEEWRATK